MNQELIIMLKVWAVLIIIFIGYYWFYDFDEKIKNYFKR